MGQTLWLPSAPIKKRREKMDNKVTYLAVTEENMAKIAEMVYKKITAKWEENNTPSKKMYVKDAMRYLQVTRTTLWRWQQAGYLLPDGKVGDRPFYYKSTLDKVK